MLNRLHCSISCSKITNQKRIDLELCSSKQRRRLLILGSEPACIVANDMRWLQSLVILSIYCLHSDNINIIRISNTVCLHSDDINIYHFHFWHRSSTSTSNAFPLIDLAPPRPPPLIFHTRHTSQHLPPIHLPTLKRHQRNSTCKHRYKYLRRRRLHRR